ncbi:hypothetical protein [Noviherbaspirillum malthae]|uniref:hypothetical protein n=1 Tax=Noviherbaspirillum malthae TaxID=1260987 RepID=UPI00188F568C|nr:hypothetical protein [Noviherbaspirillum malthae]
MTTHENKPMQQTTTNGFDANHLLDILIDKLNLKNDAALCRKLGVTPPVLSKIRHGKMPVGATLLITMHEESGISIKELRRLMGDTAERFHKNSNDEAHR